MRARTSCHRASETYRIICRSIESLSLSLSHPDVIRDDASPGCDCRIRARVQERASGTYIYIPARYFAGLRLDVCDLTRERRGELAHAGLSNEMISGSRWLVPWWFCWAESGGLLWPSFEWEIVGGCGMGLTPGYLKFTVRKAKIMWLVMEPRELIT